MALASCPFIRVPTNAYAYCTCLILLILLQLHCHCCTSFIIQPLLGSTSAARIKHQHELSQVTFTYTSLSLSMILQSTLHNNNHDADTNISQMCNSNTTNMNTNTPTNQDLQAAIEAIRLIPLSLNKRQVMSLPSNQRYQHRIRQLLHYNATHGSLDVPYNYQTDIQLAKWVQSQRYEYKLYQKSAIGVKSYLTKDRIELLDYIGFPWNNIGEREDGLSKKWMANFQMLKAYKLLYGHACVPEIYVCCNENLPLEEQVPVQLGIWVKNQRRNARIRPTDARTIMRTEKLNEVGFVWDTREEGVVSSFNTTWTTRYEELKCFGDTQGHFHVPMNESREYDRLALWLRSQRSSYRQFNWYTMHKTPNSSKDCAMTATRIQLLNDIGFDWDGLESLEQRRNDTWWDRFEELRLVHDTFGHINIGRVVRGDGISILNTVNALAICDLDLNRLHRWTKTQRVQYNEWTWSNGTKTCLNRERIKAMNELGFTWDKRTDLWHSKFQRLIAFGDKYNHYNVPTAIPRNEIASFYEAQEGALSNRQEFWDNMIELGRWARGQRSLYRKYKRGENVSNRTRALMRLLDDIGFLKVGKVSDESISAARGASPEEKKLIWDQNFAKLETFQNKHGHCFIPYPSDDNDIAQKYLYEWVVLQRRRFRIIVKKTNQGQSIGAIDLERFEKLEVLGFIFNVHEHKFQCSVNKLRVFYSRFGHSKVSPSHRDDPHLYTFVRRQRHLYRERLSKGAKNSLSDERIEKLSQLDFVWCPRGCSLE